jgi:hypothetical protein
LTWQRHHRVSGSVIEMGELTTREADATFAELICADPQWLRAEFDALITAGFGAPPAWPRPPAPPRVPPRRPPASPFPPPRRNTRPAPAVRVTRREHRRQRSPPPLQPARAATGGGPASTAET